MSWWLSPSLPLLIAALALPFLTRAWRPIVMLAAPVLSLVLIWSWPEGAVVTTRFLDLQLTPLKTDTLSRLFGTIFSIMAFAGAWYGYRQARTVELCAAFVYAGASLGVVFAGDLLTLFVFWEVMALASGTIIWSAGTQGSWHASMRYMLVHLLGGVVLMIGVVAWAQSSADLNFSSMTQALSAGGGQAFAAWAILAGFLLNAGAPPLSAWLADAYPEASPSGTVFLSAFTTKTAVYVLLRGFPGADILIWVGLFMVFYGIIYALLENDMRRILAYSIINQVGFMVTGIGIGTPLALNGAAAHAFTHIIYKALLLMSAGSVLHMTGRRKCSELGGLFQSMPVTAVCGIIGALAISSFPLTSGFISKSMVSSAAGYEQLGVVWLLLAAASAGVFLHAGIKFPWFVFFQKDSGLRPPDPPLNMTIPMLIFAALSLLLGIFPGSLYALLPFDAVYVPYTASHVVSQLQLLLFAGLAFFVLLPLMKRTLTISLDFDWFYRRAPVRLWSSIGPPAIELWSLFLRRIEIVLISSGDYFRRHYGQQGLAQVLSSSGLGLVVLSIFTGVLLFFYFQ